MSRAQADVLRRHKIRGDSNDYGKHPSPGNQIFVTEKGVYDNMKEQMADKPSDEQRQEHNEEMVRMRNRVNEIHSRISSNSP